MMSRKKIKKQPVRDTKKALAGFHAVMDVLRICHKRKVRWRRAWLITTGLALIAATLEAVRCLKLPGLWD